MGEEGPSLHFDKLSTSDKLRTAQGFHFDKAQYKRQAQPKSTYQLKTSRLGVIGGRTLRDDVNRLWARLRGQPDPTLKIGQSSQSPVANDSLWTLRDVSFEVQRGEVVGDVIPVQAWYNGSRAKLATRCLSF